MAFATDSTKERDGITDSPPAPAVIVDAVYKSFGNQHVLDGVSLTIERGQTLAMLGRSGTGKSVLLRLIIGLEKPDSGSLCVLGRTLNGLTLDELGEVRLKMGFLFQNGALYDSLSVGENVAFPLRHHRNHLSDAEIIDRVKQLLNEVGMSRHLEKAPASLSGGMRKRVGLARALALDPEILLLDEPTAGLDPISSGEINDLVLKLKTERKMTSIVVTHDMLSARTIADRLALLNHGRVAIDGTFDDLKQSEDPFVVEFLKHS
jgi:phospholipid/cholesterol/gamma-HCH transport system ATP-binding protein